MIIIIIFIIFGITVGIIAGKNNKSISLGILIGGFSVGIFGCVGALISLSLPMKTEYKCIEKYNIVALQDNSGISGSFFLGCGNIEERMAYFSYVDIEQNGSFKLEKFETYMVSIKFSDQQPHLEKWQYVPIKGSIMNYFALDDFDTKFIFYVPQGSIKQNFNLDAQ